jgi:uncharacterized protein (DUF305 family)
MKKATTLAALVLASALTLTGCVTGAEGEDAGYETTATDASTVSATGTGTATGSSEEIAAERNDADVVFARMMIPRHQQAVERSEIMLAQDKIPTEVRGFARKVIDARGAEIERMNAMLNAWGQEPVGMEDIQDHGGMMSGMMREEDMAALEEAQDAQAARLYLRQMSAHHEGAVVMAQDEVDNGQNPQAVALAEQIIQDQESEITQMEQMLQKLPAS